MSVKLFYSYSHKDEAYRETLETHLAILKRQKFIEAWHDRRIAPGSDWEEEINLNLEKAEITLLLVSSDFLASDYCYDTETIFALEQHEKGHCVVIPVILRPCLWTKSHFRKLQALPKNGKPISTWDNADEAWLNVAEGVLKVVEQLAAEKAEQPTRSGPLMRSRRLTIKNQPMYRLSRNKAEAKEPTIDKTPGSRGKAGSANASIGVDDFLKAFSRWYFSPLRIQKWGSQQPGFEALGQLSLSSIKAELKRLEAEGELVSTTSKNGNTIYKAR